MGEMILTGERVEIGETQQIIPTKALEILISLGLIKPKHITVDHAAVEYLDDNKMFGGSIRNKAAILRRGDGPEEQTNIDVITSGSSDNSLKSITLKRVWRLTPTNMKKTSCFISWFSGESAIPALSEDPHYIITLRDTINEQHNEAELKFNQNGEIETINVRNNEGVGLLKVTEDNQNGGKTFTVQGSSLGSVKANLSIVKELGLEPKPDMTINFRETLEKMLDFSEPPQKFTPGNFIENN